MIRLSPADAPTEDTEVPEVVPDDQMEARVGEVASRLAAGPTLAYGAVRRAVVFSSAHSLTDSLDFEEQMMTRTGTSEDHRAAVDAFLAKERPAFTGR